MNYPFRPFGQALAFPEPILKTCHSPSLLHAMPWFLNRAYLLVGKRDFCSSCRAKLRKNIIRFQMLGI